MRNTMKNTISFLLILILGIMLNACVDDYQDANPPRLLDAPAVSSVTAADDLIFDGQSTQITIVVVDCPAGIDSVAYEIADENGDPIGTVTIDNLDEMKGQTKGDIVATYTSVAKTAAEVTLTFTVYDLQEREGEEIRKSSVPQSAEVTIVCASELAGTYNAVSSGTSTDGDAAINPAVDIQSVITLTATSTPGEYTIDKSTGKVMDAWYLGIYYGDPIDVAGVLKDACGSITLDSYEGPWGEGIIESNGSFDANGVITFTAMNEFGDEWTVIMTPQ
jgi:hypothetical protein